MVRENATETTFKLRCRGDEGSPKGRHRGESCTCVVEGKITVKYKSSATTNLQ
jgi:hypothetical protein